MAKGLKGLDKMLKTLNTTKDKTAKKCARAGISAGMTPVMKAMRSQINSTSAGPAVKRAARKTVGKSLKKKGGQYVGKMGLGVGKPRKGKERTSRRGIGLSKANIHWSVFGTAERYHKSGQGTGKIEAVLKGVVPRSIAAARNQIKEAMRKKVKQVLARETAKLAK